MILLFFSQPELKQNNSYISQVSTDDSPGKTIVIFSPADSNQAGALAKTLKVFDDFGIDLSHIESRSSTRVAGKILQAKGLHKFA